MPHDPILTSESRAAGKKAVLGLVFALGIGVPAGVAYADSCGCSGSACGGCRIYMTGCTSCTTNCAECQVTGTTDCTLGWECP